MQLQYHLSRFQFAMTLLSFSHKLIYTTHTNLDKDISFRSLLNSTQVNSMTTLRCSVHGSEKNSGVCFSHLSGHWVLARCALPVDSSIRDHILFISTSASFMETLESQGKSQKVPFKWCGHCSQICISTKKGCYYSHSPTL